MYDFCFTIPYGILMLAGGIVGYVRKGSIASLAGGASTGVLLLLAAYISLRAYEKGKISYPALILETGVVFYSSDICAFALTFIMGQRYIRTSKIMPAGVVSALSAIMSCFYIYKLATGGSHMPSKVE